MSTVMDVVDEIRDGVPIPDESERNDVAAPPLRHAPKTLYLWAGTEELTPGGDGSYDESSVALRLEYCAAPVGEEAKTSRSRETSIELADAVAAVKAWIRSHRRGAAYEGLRARRVQNDTVRTLNFRGFAIDLVATYMDTEGVIT